MTVTPPRSHTVIVGASVGGLSVAENLRLHGYDGGITVLERSAQQPCDRPPLSKTFLSKGEADDVSLPFAQTAAAHDVRIQLDEEVVSLDVATTSISCASGRRYVYEDLVIATGSRARRLPVPGREAKGIHVLRDRADALGLRRALRKARVAVVVGAGALGLEVSSSMRDAGLQVHVITNLATPLTEDFGAAVAEFEIDALTHAGVHYWPHNTVARYLTASDHVTHVELASGDTISCDLVVEAVGAAPCTEWLSGTGLVITDGVKCDSTLRAAEHIYAVGDVCRWFNATYDRSMRVEHWTNAVEQSEVVANNIAHSVRQAYRAIPYFWSDHFGNHLQFAGTTVEASTTSVERDPQRNMLTVRYLHADGRELGVLALNSPRAVVQHRQLAASVRPV